MNFKKYIAVMLLVLLSSESTIWAVNSNGVTPLFSPKQLNIGMNNFKNYLDKVKRCLATGPCKQEELMQVKRHGLFLLKLLAAVALVGLVRWKVKKEIEKAPERIKRGAKWLSQVIKKELLVQTLDILEESADPGGDPEKIELKRLKDRIKEELDRNFKAGSAWTVEEFVAFVDDVLKPTKLGPPPEREAEAIFRKREREARMKENLLTEFHGVVEGMVEAVMAEIEKQIGAFKALLEKAITAAGEAIEKYKEKAGKFLLKLPSQDRLVEIIGEMTEKLSTLTKDQVVAIFKDEKIRTSLKEFINKIGDESHVLAFIKQLNEKGLTLKYEALKATKFGIPKQAEFRLGFGEKELVFGTGEEGSEESEVSSEGTPSGEEGEEPAGKKKKKKKGTSGAWSRRLGGKKKSKGKEEPGREGMEEGT